MTGTLKTGGNVSCPYPEIAGSKIGLNAGTLCISFLNKKTQKAGYLR